MVGTPPAGLPTIPNPIDALNKALDFASDPLGFLATKAQEGAHTLLSAVLPAMVNITHPDLSVQGFYDSYRLSFGLAIFLAIFFLLRAIADLAANRVSGTEVVETLTFYFPGFLAAVMFGPAAANSLLAASGQLTTVLVNWAVGSSVDQVTTRVLDAINKDSAADFIGGSFVALVVYITLLLACILIMLTLITLAVTQYLTGIAFPLGVAWIVHPRKRHLGWRIVYIWLGVAGTPPLLFLMLGGGLRLVDSLTQQFPSDALAILVRLLIVIVVLVLVATTPMLLTRFAPVLPGITDSGASYSPDAGGTGGSGAGDSQMGQLSRDNAASSTGEDADAAAPSLSQRIRAHHGPTDGSSTASAQQSAAAPAESSMATAVAAPAEAGTAVSATGASVSGAGAAGAGAGAGMEVAGTAVAAETGGAAVASTGIGAPVGLAIMGAGVVMAGAAVAVEAAQTTIDHAQTGADMAADHVNTDPTFEDRGR